MIPFTLTTCCPTGRERSICTCGIGAMPSKSAGPASRPLRQICISPAARSSGPWESWSSTVIWSACPATAPTAAAPPTSTRCDKKQAQPPRGDYACLLNRGGVHDEPPRRTHSIGGISTEERIEQSLVEELFLICFLLKRDIISNRFASVDIERQHIGKHCVCGIVSDKGLLVVVGSDAELRTAKEVIS